jgi:hypothetical protein
LKVEPIRRMLHPNLENVGRGEEVRATEPRRRRRRRDISAPAPGRTSRCRGNIARAATTSATASDWGSCFQGSTPSSMHRSHVSPVLIYSLFRVNARHLRCDLSLSPAWPDCSFRCTDACHAPWHCLSNVACVAPKKGPDPQPYLYGKHFPCRLVFPRHLNSPTSGIITRLPSFSPSSACYPSYVTPAAMSLIPIYTGFWHDYSRDGSLAWTLTLTVRWSGVLLAALSTFVGLVGTCFWSLLAFAIHQWRAKSGDEDTVYFQQQVIYRNPGSAPGALIDLFKVCWAWSPRRSGRTRPNRLRRRYFLFSTPPFLVFIGFTAASVFVGEVTRPSYQSNDVEIKPTNCGTVLFDLKTIGGFRDDLLKSVNDTLAARAYARNCYGPNTALGACSLYPTQSLPYSVSETPCPFGKDPTGKELCSANSALQVDTGLLDINKYLGINTPKKDRLLFRKSATCSPINSRPYAKTANIPDGAGYAIWNYYLGPVNGAPNNTLSYDTHTADDIVGYTLE